MSRNQVAILFAAVIAVFAVSAVLVEFFGGVRSGGKGQSGESVVARPVTDIKCGETYEFTHLERFYVNGRVAVNFYFGGTHRNLRPQYIWDENVIGQSVEIRKARRVNPSLEYSRVTFLCLSDPVFEGHRISNVEVMRYRLTLRRPLRQQRVIRKGGTPRR